MHFGATFSKQGDIPKKIKLLKTIIRLVFSVFETRTNTVLFLFLFLMKCQRKR